MYLCLGCYEHQEPIERECFIPYYDAPDGSMDSYDIEYHVESPLIDGLCYTCYRNSELAATNHADIDSDDDDLPF